MLLEMESNGDGGGRGRRPSNSYQQQQRLERPLRKVQVVYYLSRNGQLEHPHFIELPYLPNHHQLRLRDVVERLTLLRGEAMPSHFSWSCKRSSKNGYVWNDLAEYVLKGSEIIPGAYENFRHVPVGGRRQKPLLVSNRPHLELEEEAALMAAKEEITRHSKCSRGVSTEEIERVGARTELPLDDSFSPPSTISSGKPGGGNT
ncbi:protein SOSEKI 2-like [Zingiber officinale]|uniref:protein SOSEKI 2-like n=1 Tax=Zingiber officinale TaxID=94328 RepID=UPI001C4AE935|nr:protein SOSEKI 2-like [Zingiber officinale]